MNSLRVGRTPLVRHSWILVRHLILAPRRKRQRRPLRPVDEMESMKYKLEARVLDEKLKELQQLAQSVKSEISKRKENLVKMEVGSTEIGAEDEDVDMIFNDLMLEGGTPLALPSTGGVSLFDTPAKGISVPHSILAKLGDSVRHIVVKHNPNWDALVEDLAHKHNGFVGLTKYEIDKFLAQIPAGAINAESVQLLEKKLSEVLPKWSGHHYDFFMKHHAANGDASKTQELWDLALRNEVKITKYMYAHLIKAYTKTKDLPRINATLQKAYDSNIEPSLAVYTNILQLCVTLKDQRQADEVFQMMKFRSTRSKPDIEAYNTMIQLASRNRDIHRALDLYHELLSEGLEPTVFTFNCLIQACSKAKDHLLKGYDFLAEIYSRDLEPNVKTFECMLRLVARDGDLELCRAIYVTIFEKSSKYATPGPEALSYILMAYRDFKPEHMPSIMHHTDGVTLRRNILRMVDFMGLHQSQVQDVEISRKRETYPPLLPVSRITDPRHIIAESNALWAFNVVRDPGVLNAKTLIVYLRIAIEHGDKHEFLKRWEQYSFCHPETVSKLKVENAEDDDKTVELATPPALAYLRQMNYKVERSSELYLTYLSAGKRFGDAQMCQDAWEERGKYRATSAYQSLSRNTKARLDFRFAKEMVLGLTELGLIQDAVNVVKSSENQFPWTFYALKPLYVACERIGDSSNAREISAICGKHKGMLISARHD